MTHFGGARERSFVFVGWRDLTFLVAKSISGDFWHFFDKSHQHFFSISWRYSTFFWLISPPIFSLISASFFLFSDEIEHFLSEAFLFPDRSVFRPNFQSVNPWSTGQFWIWVYKTLQVQKGILEGWAVLEFRRVMQLLGQGYLQPNNRMSFRIFSNFFE